VCELVNIFFTVLCFLLSLNAFVLAGEEEESTLRGKSVIAVQPPSGKNDDEVPLKTQGHIYVLPDEVLEYILCNFFEYPRDYRSIRLVSLRFKRCMEGWKIIRPSRRQGDISGILGEMGGVRNLTMSGCRSSSWPLSDKISVLKIRNTGLINSVLDAIICSCPHLRHLDISHNPKLSEFPETPLTDLRILKLERTQLSNASLRNLFQSAQNMQDLSVSGGQLSRFFTYLRQYNINLKALTVVMGRNRNLGVSQDELREFLQFNSNLRELNIAGQQWHGLIPTLLTNLPGKMQVLKIRDTGLTDGALDCYFSRAVGLEVLDVSRNHQLARLPALPPFNRLKSLNVSNTRLTEEALRNFRQSAPHLSDLVGSPFKETNRFQTTRSLLVDDVMSVVVLGGFSVVTLYGSYWFLSLSYSGLIAAGGLAIDCLSWALDMV